MKKHIIIEGVLAILLVCSIGFIIVNQSQSTANKSKEDTKVTDTTKAGQKEINSLKKKVNRLTTEKSQLQTQLDIEKNNNQEVKGENQEFQDVVNNAFSALYNFEPDTMKDRKEASEPYLSDDLMSQYFNDQSVYGDSAGAESELLGVNLYTKTVQGTTINGFVVANYQSRMSGMEWTKGRNIFQVAYDTNTKKIMEIQNLGSSNVLTTD